MIKKTIYNNNLRTPDSYTVECGNKTKTFMKGSERCIGEWIMSLWNNDFFPMPANVYYNIGWENDHILYCKYELN